MNPALRNLSLALFVFYIAACQKPSDDDPGTDPNFTTYHISRIVQDAASAPGGQVSVTDFVYDDQLRIDKIVYSSGDSINGGLTTYPIQTQKFYYNGSERNPYKTTGRSPSNIAWSADVYYYYNNAGQLIRDSLKSTSGSDIVTRNYSYSADKIIVKKTTYVNGAGNMLTDSFVVKDHNLAETYYGSPSGGALNYGFKCNYDNKTNPIAILNIAVLQTVDGVDGFPSYLAPGFCHNNITEFSSGYTNLQGQFIVAESHKFSYSYNKNGWPEQCVTSTNLDTYIMKYYYKE